MANASTLLIARYDEKLGKQGNLIPSPHLEGVLLTSIFTLGFIAPKNSPLLRGRGKICGRYVEKICKCPFGHPPTLFPYFLAKKVGTFSTTHPLNFHNFDFYYT